LILNKSEFNISKIWDIVFFSNSCNSSSFVISIISILYSISSLKYWKTSPSFIIKLVWKLSFWLIIKSKDFFSMSKSICSYRLIVPQILFMLEPLKNSSVFQMLFCGAVKLYNLFSIIRSPFYYFIVKLYIFLMKNVNIIRAF